MQDSFKVAGPTALAFAQSFQYLEEAVRRGVVDRNVGTLPNQGRLLVELIMKNTPPKKSKTGNDAVARSLKGLTRPLTPAQFTSPRLAKIVQRGDINAWNIVSTRFKQTNRLVNSEAVKFDRGHYSHKSSKGTRRKVILGPEVSKFNKFVKERQASVGKGKAAWTLALIALGGKKPPSWISRHGTEEGVYIDGMTGKDPRITVGNMSSWAEKGRNPASIITDAIRFRTVAMRKYAHKAMDRAGRQYERLANNVLKTARFFG